MNTLKNLTALIAVALASATVNAAQVTTTAAHAQGKSSFVQSASTIVTKDNVAALLQRLGPSRWQSCDVQPWLAIELGQLGITNDVPGQQWIPSDCP